MAKKEKSGPLVKLKTLWGEHMMVQEALKKAQTKDELVKVQAHGNEVWKELMATLDNL